MKRSLDLREMLGLAADHFNHQRFNEAQALCGQILDSTPDQPMALHLLGRIAGNQGDRDRALDLLTRVAMVAPDYAAGRIDLGQLLYAGRDFEGALVQFEAAAALAPETFEARANRGLTLIALDRPGDAASDLCWAFLQRPESRALDRPLIRSLARIDADTFPEPAVLRSVLADLLDRPGLAIASIAGVLERTLMSGRDLEGPDTPPDLLIETLLSDDLCRRYMQISPVLSVPLERRLARARRHLLARAVNAGARFSDIEVAFTAALAEQCFLNGYVYPVTAEEQDHLQRLETGAADPLATRLILACYRPLRRADMDGLDGRGTGSLARLIAQQIEAPEREQASAANIQTLTPILDDTSKQVRRQYEENPYPRWTKSSAQPPSPGLGPFLRDSFPGVELPAWDDPGAPAALIAGCGTGQQVLSVATQFPETDFLAIDFSRASLGYAMRKLADAGVDNVRFAQADILELGRMDKPFDFVECSGVLHHLADPVAGWRQLAQVLRPGGLMRIGLYNRSHRGAIRRAREDIRTRGLSPDPDVIRTYRQEVMERADAGDPDMANIAASNDFFDLNSCRDLLFHEMEHQYDIASVQACIEELGLRFIGFQLMDADATETFRRNHADGRAAASFEAWAAFEREHPAAFGPLLTFYCQKP